MWWRTSSLLLLLMLPVTGWSSTDSLHCGRELVRAGDPIWQVGRKCPEPFWEEHYDRARAYDRLGRPLDFNRYEIWTLNFGQRRLMRRLVFVNGTLARIDALGYGVDYHPGSRRCTPRELSTAGGTIAEIYARCGEPDHRYGLPGPGLYDYRSGPAHHREVRELWTYDFGSRHHPRELLFVDGRLQRITSQRR